MDALREARLKLSAAEEFNDAFDCLGVCVGEFSSNVILEHARDMLCSLGLVASCEGLGLHHEYSKRIADEILRKTFFKNSCILCFTRPETVGADALMWSHYGNKWKGVRLGFDLLYENHYPVTYDTTSPYALSPIKYSTRRAVLDLSKIGDVENDPLYSRYFYDCLQTKAESWKYESEWRLFCDEQYSLSLGGMRFWEFHKLLLRTIDLGPYMCAEEQGAIIRLARESYPHAEVRKVVLSERDFDFSYKVVQSPIVAFPAKSTFWIRGGNM
ncbi:MAG: DUF2971 domain-containing protein [bacterium]|nr:DUF2971 domain-containing protein [bacterium]